MIKARQIPTCTRAQERFCIWCALGPLAEQKLDLLDVSWGYDVSDDELVLFYPATKYTGNHPRRAWCIDELSQRSPEEVAKVFDKIADDVHLIHTSREVPPPRS